MTDLKKKNSETNNELSSLKKKIDDLLKEKKLVYCNLMTSRIII